VEASEAESRELELAFPAQELVEVESAWWILGWFPEIPRVRGY
jgi:hypothetical protein